MSTSRRVTVMIAIVALLLGACGGATPTNPPSPPTAASVTTPATATPIASAAASPSPSTSPVAVARPGYILLEHFGNAADGTPLKDTESRHLWLVHADGSDLHELAPGQPASGRTGSDKGAAEWSPDGKHIAFMSSTDGVQIYETDVDGATPRLVSTDCAKTPDDCLDFFPAYSPDGKRLAFVQLSGDPSTGVVGIRDLSAGTVTLLGSTRQGPPKQELGAAAWSPDGKQLVYYEVAKDPVGKPLGSSEMFIVDAGGTHRHALATPGLAAGDPRWSPDGSTIVFSTEPIHQWNDAGVPDQPDVYIIHPDGTGLKKLTIGGGSGAPSWTSDGKILYFSERHLWLMDADGGRKTLIGPGNMSLVSDTTGFSYYGRWQPTP